MIFPLSEARSVRRRAKGSLISAGTRGPSMRLRDSKTKLCQQKEMPEPDRIKMDFG
jgi:hypothetical protein